MRCRTCQCIRVLGRTWWSSVTRWPGGAAGTALSTPWDLPEFGLICETGIRCCYHFWHFDVDGTILETPGEPAESTLKDRLYHGAYPIREYHGLVFAYMGPAEKGPPCLSWTPLTRRVPHGAHRAARV